MNHSFDINVAEELGLNQAIIIQHIYYWHLRNEGNNKNFIDNKYWTYNSVTGFSKLFPYLSEKQIRYSLNVLKKDGYIITANHNKVGYDRTLWYAMTKKGLSLFVSSICQKGQMDLPKGTNGFVQKGEPIPDSNTDSNTNVNDNKLINILPQIKNLENIQELVINFYDYQYEHFPKQLRQYKSNKYKLVEDSVKVIDKLIRIDGYTFDEVKLTLQSAVKDDFWKKQVITLKGLRKRSKNGNTKFDNINSSREETKEEVMESIRNKVKELNVYKISR